MVLDYVPPSLIVRKLLELTEDEPSYQRVSELSEEEKESFMNLNKIGRRSSDQEKRLDSDVKELQLTQEIRRVREENGEAFGAIHKEMKENNAELREEMVGVQREMKENTSAVRGEMLGVQREMKENTAAVREEMLGVQREMKENTAAVREEMLGVQREMKENNAAVREEMLGVQKEMKESVASIQEKLFQIQNDVNELQKKDQQEEEAAHQNTDTSKPTIRFCASLSQNAVFKFPLLWSSKNRILYDVVQENVGGGYSPQTGIFTAPRPGRYRFFTHADVEKNSLLVCFFHNITCVEGKMVQKKEELVLERDLNVNDTIEVRCCGNILLGSPTGSSTVFRGHIL